MFSATLPPEIRRLADQFLNDPIEVSVSPPASAATTVTQAIVRVAPADKRAALRSLIKSEDVKNALIFCNRKRDVALVHKSLLSYGLDAGALHGDMVQSARTETLAKFKADELRLLVCSDVAARGLDIKGLSHVFNFDVPTHAEDYVHRIGRTGRAGLSGRAFMLVTPEDTKFLVAIEKLIGTTIPETRIEGFDSRDAEPELRESPPARSRSRRESPSAARGGRGGAEPSTARPPRNDFPSPRQAPPQRARYDDDDRDGGLDSGVGFGGHVPAFMIPRSGRRG
jgi:superfamily II DNA/RNA helicase